MRPKIQIGDMANLAGPHDETEAVNYGVPVHQSGSCFVSKWWPEKNWGQVV